MLTIDVSGSMCDEGLVNAKAAAKAWINAMPLGKSECAISSFNGENYFVHDFSKDRSSLINAVDGLGCGGGTDFNAGFIDMSAGALRIAKDGNYKRVIVFLTDGYADGDENEIIKMANDIDAIIYCVTLDNSTPDILKNIAQNTGGQHFDNVTTQEEAESVYRNILMLAQGGEPSEIEWMSDGCSNSTNAKIEIPEYSINSKFIYFPSYEVLPKIVFKPSRSLNFGEILPGEKIQKTIELIAIKEDITIDGIESNNPDFKIVDYDGDRPPFRIMKNKKRQLTIEFSPKDSSLQFARFEMKSNACTGKVIYAKGGFSRVPIKRKTIKLLSPNGGEKLVAGDKTTVYWEGIPPDEKVCIEFSPDGGKIWSKVAENISGESFHCKYIPIAPSINCLMRVRQIEKGHKFKRIGLGTIYSLDFNSDSKSIIAGSHTGDLIIFNASNLSIVKVLRVCNAWVTSVKFSQDGNYIAAGGFDDKVKIWDAKNGEILFTLEGHSGGITAVDFNKTSQLIVSGSKDKTIKIWDVKNGALVKTLSGHKDIINTVVFSSNGKFIASGSDDKTIKIWDVKKGKEILSLISGEGKINSIDFCPDDSQIVSGSEKDSISIWDINRGSKILSLRGHCNEINAVEYSPNGKFIASGSDDQTIKIWDANSGELIKTFDKHEHSVIAVKYNHDGSMIVSSCLNGSIRIWDVKTGKEIKILKSANSSWVEDVAYSPNDKHIVSCSQDNKIKVWDVETGNLMHDFGGLNKNYYGTDISYNPFGNYIAFSCIGNTIRVWDAETGKEKLKLNLQTEYGCSSDIQFSPDGRSIAGSTKSGITLWDVETGKEIISLKNHKDKIYHFSFSPDGKSIAGSGNDSTIRLLDIKTGKILNTMIGHSGSINSIAFSPDGKLIVSTSFDKSIRIWDVETGNELNRLWTETVVSEISFSPDGNNIAGIYGDRRKIGFGFSKTIRIWNLKTLTLKMILSGHGSTIRTFKYNFKGDKIASCSWDKTIGIWDLIGKEIQNDESDNPWSIIIPKAIAIDIDFGDVLLGSMKDSVFSAYLKNTGKAPMRIDKIEISGKDAGEFRLVSGVPPYVIPTGKSKKVEFRFKPSSVGIKKAKVTITTQVETLVQEISGEGVEPKLEVITKEIAFENVKVFSTEDETIKELVKNIGSSSLQIKDVNISGPGAEYFKILKGAGKTSLKPGESMQVTVRFQPSIIGRISAQLNIYQDASTEPANVKLSGKADVYKIIVKGIVKDSSSGDPLAVKVYWKNFFDDNDKGESICKASDGTYQFESTVGGHYEYWFEANGYLRKSKSIDLRNKKPDDIITSNIALVSIKKMIEDEIALEIENIFFETGKYDLKDESFEELKRLAEDLKKYPNVKIEIAGHTDNVGTTENNDILSQNRAKAVYNYLVKIGCNPDMMTAKGYGERQPQSLKQHSKGQSKEQESGSRVFEVRK